MKLFYFSKAPRCDNADQFIALAERFGVAGFDLCVRPGYPVEPANASRTLPPLVDALRRSGLDVPLISAPTSMNDAEDAETQQLIAAAGDAGVRLVKIGYFRPIRRDYRQQVDDARRRLETFGKFGRRYGVRICYHTHCGYLGYGAAALTHLLDGQDPSHLGAYLDTAHTWLAGEPWDAAMDMVEPYLAAVALKDATLKLQGKGRSGKQVHCPPAPQGMVDWDTVFPELHTRRFVGTVSVHAEFESIEPEAAFIDAAADQIRFFSKCMSVEAHAVVRGDEAS